VSTGHFVYMNFYFADPSPPPVPTNLIIPMHILQQELSHNNHTCMYDCPDSGSDNKQCDIVHLNHVLIAS